MAAVVSRGGDGRVDRVAKWCGLEDTTSYYKRLERFERWII